MSQAIVKAKEGTQINDNTPKIFNWSGKQYDRDTFQKSALEGLGDYIVGELGVTNRDKQTELMNTISSMAQKVMDGNLELKGTQFLDKTGELKNNGKRFDPVALGATYLTRILSKQQEYKGKEEQTPSKKKYSENNLGAFASKQGYNAGQFKNDEIGLGNLRNLINKFSEQDFSNYDLGDSFSSTEDLMQAISAAKNAISQNGLDYLTESNLFRRLGLGEDILSKFIPESGGQNQDQQSQIDALKQANAEREIQAKSDQDLFDQFWKKYKNDYYSNSNIPDYQFKFMPIDNQKIIDAIAEYTNNIAKSDPNHIFGSYEDEAGNYVRQLVSNAYNPESGWLYNPNFNDQSFNKQEFNDKLNYLLNTLRYYKSLTNSGEIINDKGNEYYWRLATEPYERNQYIWGTDSNGIVKPFKIEGDVFNEYFQSLYNQMPSESYYNDLLNQVVPINKKGGILKALIGGNTPEPKIPPRPEISQGRTEDQNQIDALNRQAFEDWIKSNQLHMYGAYADAISTIASLFDKGTIPSSLAGIAGTTLHGIAGNREAKYAKHPKSAVAANIGTSALFMAADVIPIGTNVISSPAKLVKWCKASKPWIETLSAVGALANIPNDVIIGRDIFKKLANDEEVKLDWSTVQALSRFFLYAAKAGRTIRSNVKYKNGEMEAMFRRAINPEKSVLETEGKKRVAVSSKDAGDVVGQHSTYQAASGKDKQREAEKFRQMYLKATGGAEPRTDLLGRYTDPSTTGVVYDLSSLNRIEGFNDVKNRFSRVAKRHGNVIDNNSTPSYSKEGREYSLINDKQQFINQLIDGKSMTSAQKTKAWNDFNARQLQANEQGGMKGLYEEFGLNPVTFEYKSGGIINFDKISTYKNVYKNGGIIKAEFGTLMNRKKYQGSETLLNPGYDVYDRNKLEDMSNYDKWYNLSNANFSGITNVEALNKLLNTATGDNTKYNGLGWKDWNEAYEATGLNKYFGYDEGVANYYGPSTANRVALLNLLKQNAANGIDTGNGILYYKDNQFSLQQNPGNQQTIAPTPTVAQTPETPETTGDETGSTFNPGWFKNAWDKAIDFNKNYITPLINGDNINPNHIANARLLWTLHNNKRVTNMINNALEPALDITYNLQRYIHGNKSQQSAYEDAGNRQLTLTKNNLGSDQALNLSGMLEAQDRANQSYIQGNLVNDQAVKNSIEQAWQAEADNKARYTALANSNNMKSKDIKLAKVYNNAALRSKLSSAIDTRLQEVEYNQRAKQDRLRQLGLQQYMGQLQIDQLEDLEYQDIIRKLRAIESNPDPSATDSQEYQKLLIEKQKRDNDYQNKAYRKQIEILNSPFVTVAKRGTKVTVRKKDNKIENDKILHRSVKNKLDNHMKLLDNLSAVTKQLILKALT